MVSWWGLSRCQMIGMYANAMTDNDQPSLEAVANSLADRLSPAHLDTRLQAERRKESVSVSRLQRMWRSHKRDLGRNFIGATLNATRMRARGQKNLLGLTVNHNRVAIDGLPAQFDGYRLLHLSDLHLDMHAGLAGALTEKLADVTYDACVITGDFRARTFGPIGPCMDALSQVRAALNTDVYCVLGNHDSLRMVPVIERMGITLLLNERIILQRQQSSLALIGVDDPHYFRCDDLSRAISGIAEGVPKVLLAHSPEIWQQAAEQQVSLYLCGHTHGGQICLPGGLPLFINARAPRAMAKGVWRHGAMQGYTSNGSGTSVVDARFNCPPEATIHTLNSVK